MAALVAAEMTLHQVALTQAGAPLMAAQAAALLVE